MTDKFEFEGIPSGDYECFCWDVTPEVYRELTGEEPNEYTRTRIEEHEGLDLHRVYFSHLIRVDENRVTVKQNCKFKIEITYPDDE